MATDDEARFDERMKKRVKPKPVQKHDWVIVSRQSCAAARS
jgi:hypothetical protein